MPDYQGASGQPLVEHVGPSLGSHNQIVTGPAADFAVAETDTRRLMVRQIWGAHVLQGGRDLPDCESNRRWTFTLFPGEGLTDGCADRPEGQGAVPARKTRPRYRIRSRGSRHRRRIDRAGTQAIYRAADDHRNPR